MSKPVRFRKFLNSSEYGGVASISYEIEDEGGCYQYCSLTLTDCRHTITLDFPLDRVEQRSNSIYKLEVLKQVIEQFQKEMFKIMNSNPLTPNNTETEE